MLGIMVVLSFLSLHSMNGSLICIESLLKKKLDFDAPISGILGIRWIQTYDFTENKHLFVGVYSLLFILLLLLKVSINKPPQDMLFANGPIPLDMVHTRETSATITRCHSPLTVLISYFLLFPLPVYMGA